MVWNLGDLFLAIVIVPNLIALVILVPKVVADANSYFERQPWLRQPGARRPRPGGGD